MRKRAKGDNKIEDFQFFDSDAEFNLLLKKKIPMDWVEWWWSLNFNLLLFLFTLFSSEVHVNVITVEEVKCNNFHW